jgi:hypothetical protein
MSNLLSQGATDPGRHRGLGSINGISRRAGPLSSVIRRRGESPFAIMTTPQSTNARFIEKFEEQLRFIQRSCELFDRGAEDEALRLATTLRIIFHDTINSTSLIRHLGFFKKRMLSSSRGHGNWQDYLASQIDLASPQPVRMLPLLGDRFVELSIED